jgi:hypothetical protein
LKSDRKSGLECPNGFGVFVRSLIGLPDRPRGRSSVAHLTGATDDRAINLGAFNAPTPPKSRDSDLPRKEVIQPHLPVRLPCYDFVPITDPTFDGCLLAVGPPASGVTSFHDVTGGVYKAREHIHRSNADLRLLATPASCRRVAAYNPN